MCVILAQKDWTWIIRFVFMCVTFVLPQNMKIEEMSTVVIMNLVSAATAEPWYAFGFCCKNSENGSRLGGKKSILNQLIIWILESLICTFWKCQPQKHHSFYTECKCQHNTHASIMHELWTLETIKNKLCKTNHYYSDVPDIIHRQPHREIASSIINGWRRKFWNKVIKW